MNDLIFDTYSKYYDLLYRDKDYAAEAAYIMDLLDRFGVKKGNLLEFGSGTGKHGQLLAGSGYNVHGIERSAAMLRRADLSKSGFTCTQGDICQVNLRRKFDAVLALFHVVSYQVTNAEILAVFKNAASHLRRDGLFIFDFWYTPAVYSLQPSTRVKRIGDDEVEITRIAEPSTYENKNRVDVAYTVFVHHKCARDKIYESTQVLRETHSMRHFGLPELDLVAQLTGFKLINAEEFLSKAPPSLKTWTVSVVLQKD